MSSDDVVHSIGVLESRVDRVCKFLSGMYWSSYLEEFKSLEQKVIGLDKSLYERINEVKVEMEEDVKSKVKECETKMEKEVKSRVDRLETEIAEGVPVISEQKKGLAKEVFSVDMKFNLAQIEVKDKNIKEVSKGCLKGLSLIMKEYGNISLYSCFGDCKNLTTLTFPSTFDTGNVTNMSWMFNECSSLSSLDLSTFNTSSVTNMNGMFADCSSLSSLDLSTFDTSSVTNMNGMFADCSSLSSLNLSTFNTSSVTSMFCMFEGCSSLSSLDLSTFNTSSATNMFCMFARCSSLSSLDLSTFDTSSVEPDGDFSGCTDMFEECSKLKEVCVKDKRIKSGLRRGVAVKTK